MTLTEGNYGFLVARMRKAKGFTQKELANMLGLSEGYISKIENYKANPRITTIARIADICGFTLTVK